MKKLLLLLIPFLLIAKVDIKIKDKFQYHKDTKTYNAEFKIGKKIVKLKGLGTFTKGKTDDKLKINWVYTKYKKKNIDLREVKLMSNLKLNKNEKVKKGINVTLDNENDINPLKLIKTIEKSYKKDKNQISFESIKKEFKEQQEYVESKKKNSKNNTKKEKEKKPFNPHNAFQSGKFSNKNASGTTKTSYNPSSSQISESLDDEDETKNLTEFDCQPKVIGESVQFYQIQENNCVAMATPVAIYENESVCENKLFYDDKKIEIYSRREAKPSYSGSIYVVESCRLKEVLPIQSTTKDITDGIDNTGILADLAKMKAIQYQKWYYTKNGVRVFIGEAVPTNTTYPLKTTTVGCEAEITKAKGIYNQDDDDETKLGEEYFLNFNRIVFEDNFGIVREVRGCEPLGLDNFIKVVTEPAKDSLGNVDYVHYPALGYARLNVIKYYIHPSTGKKMYLNNKAKSPDMEHIFYYQEEACVDETSKELANEIIDSNNKGYTNGWYHDDELKKSSYVTAKFFIDNVNFENKKYYIGGSKTCDAENSKVVIPYIDITADDKFISEVKNAKGDKIVWSEGDPTSNKIIKKPSEKFYYDNIEISIQNGLSPKWNRIFKRPVSSYLQTAVGNYTAWHATERGGECRSSSGSSRSPSPSLTFSKNICAVGETMNYTSDKPVWNSSGGSCVIPRLEFCGDKKSCYSVIHFSRKVTLTGSCDRVISGYQENLALFEGVQKWLRADGSLLIEEAKRFYKIKSSY